jgi:radical SAM superfamily enzyme YgiQ (UPF0313 family)
LTITDQLSPLAANDLTIPNARASVIQPRNETFAGNVSNGVVALTLNGNEMASFDLEGRVLYYANGSSAYRRSIYNEVFKLKWIGKEERIVERIWNPYQILERAYEIARTARRLSNDPFLTKELDTISSRTTLWLADDAENAETLYKRISIVPPDLYFSIYLQLTTGCVWSRCTFCNLYRDRNYSVKYPAIFSQHLKAVKEYLGRGIESRRRVFLGDANAMAVKKEWLEKALAMIADELSNPPVYSFVDGFTTPKNSSGMDFAKLRRLGLKRVYLGLESGDPEVLKILNKPMELNQAKEFVRQLKSAGLNVGIIILVGAGGHAFWNNHAKLSASVLEEIGLEKGDIVYLSPIVETDFYKDLSERLRLGILSQDEKEIQARQIKTALEQSSRIKCPVVRYDVRESFVS